MVGVWGPIARVLAAKSVDINLSAGLEPSTIYLGMYITFYSIGTMYIIYIYGIHINLPELCTTCLSIYNRPNGSHKVNIGTWSLGPSPHCLLSWYLKNYALIKLRKAHGTQQIMTNTTQAIKFLSRVYSRSNSKKQ